MKVYELGFRGVLLEMAASTWEFRDWGLGFRV